MTIDINLREVVLRITERIWLRAFGTSPKSGKAGLQIRSERYRKWREINGGDQNE